jgi:hypothetical protein
VTATIGAAIAVALVAAGIWLVVRGVEAEPSVVGSLATAASAVIAVVWSRSREQKAQLAQSHREQMAPIYEQLFMHVTRLVDSGGEPSPDQLEFYRDLHRKLLFYGSTPVINAWLTWTRGDSPVDGDPAAMLRFERVLFAIRADLGHDNSGLQPGDLLRTTSTTLMMRYRHAPQHELPLASP